MKDDPYQVATLLLGTLLERRKLETETFLESILRKVSPDYKIKQEQEKLTIEECVTILSNRRNNAYDPTTSLLGPLYCTLYAYNPSNPDQESPLWERISLQASNLKGQQYFLNRDFALSVINYAEVWGSAAAIRAQARFAPRLTQSDSSVVSEETSILPPFLSGKKTPQAKGAKSSVLRTCPDVFDIELVQAELSFSSGQAMVPIPIQGSAQFAVMYADPRLRILSSRTGSDSIVGEWEQSGLVAVQVRSDLVTKDATPLDLR